MGHFLLDFAFLLVFALFILLYAKRGLIKSAIHFFKTLLAIVAAYLFGGKLGALLCNGFVGNGVRGFVYDKIQAMYASAAGNLSAEEILQAFPSFLRTESVRAALAAGEGSGEMAVQSATDAISTPIASAISNVLGYIGVFLIALAVLWIVAAILTKIVEKITILDLVNTILGGVFGFVMALVILFAVASVIKLFWAQSPLYADSLLVKLLGESALLEKIKIFNLGAL